MRGSWLIILLFLAHWFLVGSLIAQEKARPDVPATVTKGEKEKLVGTNQSSGLWIEVLAFFVVAGVFGGILGVLRPLPQSTPTPPNTNAVAQARLIVRADFWDYFTGAIGGIGGSIAGMAVMLIDGRITNSPLSDTQRLSFICAGVLSGYLGFGLLQMVADRFNRYLQKALEQSVKVAQESERKTETFVTDTARLTAAVNAGLVALDHDPDKRNDAIRELVSTRQDFPDNRALNIVLARLYRQQGDLDKAIRVLSSAAQIMHDDPKKAEGVYYNRSIYYSLLADKTSDVGKKADLRTKAITDLKKAIELMPENYQAALEDKDFEALRTDPRFVGLKPSP